MAKIHPTAVIERGAVLADDVEIGAFAVIGFEVELGPQVEVGTHASVLGKVRIAARTRVYPHAALGGEPQDRDPRGEPCELAIGEDNVIREFATIHVGTERGGGCTRIGDDNMIMNYSHIAHDCQIGSHCIITGPIGIAGHVIIEDHAVLGAFVGVHQFSRVGTSVMAASNAMLSRDAPPYSLVAGDRARLVGVNTIGLRRRGFDNDTIREIKHAFHLLFHSRLRLPIAIARVREDISDSPEVDHLLQFLEKSERGFCR